MDAVAEGSKGRVPRDCIGLVTSRAAVGELLKLDHLIDLVIPRGSGALVNHIKVDFLFCGCSAVMLVVLVPRLGATCAAALALCAGGGGPGSEFVHSHCFCGPLVVKLLVLKEEDA